MGEMAMARGPVLVVLLCSVVLCSSVVLGFGAGSATAYSVNSAGDDGSVKHYHVRGRSARELMEADKKFSWCEPPPYAANYPPPYEPPYQSPPYVSPSPYSPSPDSPAYKSPPYVSPSPYVYSPSPKSPAYKSPPYASPSPSPTYKSPPYVSPSPYSPPYKSAPSYTEPPPY